MAIIKIAKGSQRLEVTKGAFKSIFEPSGWQIADNIVEQNPTTKLDGLPFIGKDTDLDGLDGENANSTQEDDEEDDEENDDAEEDTENETNGSKSDEELLEKPLSEQSLKELRRYASLMSIDVSGFSSKKDTREAIKAAM